MHTTYYNKEGIQVPSVTTILKILDKPGLINWANYMGFNHIKVNDILDSSSHFGNCIHSFLEAFFNKSYYIHIEDERCTTNEFIITVNNFIKFMKNNSYDCEFTEKSLSCDTFGGTLDYYGKFNGKNMLIDFKTSKSVYPTYKLQLGGYYHLLKNKYKIDACGILQINKKTCKLIQFSLEELLNFEETFLILVDLYHHYKDIGGISNAS